MSGLTKLHAITSGSFLARSRNRTDRTL